jgi:eukaryotic-like serine/threonine-protein kinase
MQAGDVIDERFELEKRAGTGAMGEVWRARDRTDGVVVAIKLLMKIDEGWDTRFVREALSLAQLDHPGIVHYVAHGPLPDSFYVAMEWLDGEDLSQRLARGPLTIDETIGVVRRVAEALSFAHAHGIIHRDIKPGNLFLPGGSLRAVKLVDFGVAKIKNLTGTWTRNGSVLGTPAYMAPEQIRAEPTIDARADLFALGCVAFECATGRVAFGSGQVAATLRSILYDEAPRVGAVVPNVPAEFDQLVQRLMAKEPADRPRDASEVARLLAGFDVGVERTSDMRLARALTTDEQRLVTVLLIDGTERGPGDAPPTLVSPPTAPDDLDPSRRLGALLQRTGATFERFAGDAFAVILPPSGIPTDRAAQAARSALSLSSIFMGRNMALATGPRASARAREGAEGRAPAALDRAMALLRHGERAESVGAGGIIFLDETTAHLLDARFEVARRDALFELRRELEVEPPSDGAAPVHAMGATLVGRRTRCIGRDREIAAIHGTLAQCADESVARAVLVTAPAGGGKSQLRRALLGQLGTASEPNAPLRAAFAVRMARADPFTSGTPFGLLTQLMGAKSPDSAPASVGGTEAERRRGFDDWIAAECAKGPLLLVIEDLQWSDQPSVRALDAVLRDRKDAPIAVLAFARPDVHELFPHLWADRELEEIRLGTLTKSAGEKLIHESLGGELAAGDVARIVEQADGNPFYIEELARAARERKDAVPDTLIAMVQARLEKLDPETRRVLRAASVFGSDFWRGGVKALLGGSPDVDVPLGELVNQGLVRRSSQCRFANEEEFEFRHPLVREAAYAMLTDADRALGHDLAAHWLERVGERDEAIITGHRHRSARVQSA